MVAHTGLASPEPGSPDQPLMRDHVYEVMLGLIIDGKLSPGERITERAIAAQCGSSTTPVKEALRRLETGGFVQTLPRRGVIVSETAVTAIGEVNRVRATLDGFAAQLATERFVSGELTAHDRARLEDSVAAMTTADTAASTSVEAANTQFHQLIRELSGNLTLRRFVGMLVEVEGPLRRRALADPIEAQRGHDEHHAIAKAILSGEITLAARLMTEHVQRSGSHTLNASRLQGPR